jgi:4-hydroxy-tetrahydrodipicolinate synthase
MFQGSLVALVTPMTADAALAMDSLLHLVDWHIENGSDGLVILGTTGESVTLTEEERRLITHEVIRHVKKHASRKMPVIVGTGSNSTRTSIKWTREAMDLGADACLLVTPYYNKPTQEGLYLHFKAIAEAVAIPQILYNVPGRTACDLLPKTVGSLSAIPNIVGIKEATGDLQRVQAIRSLVPKEFELFCGDDSSNKDFILAGGNGAISVTANVAPRLMHEMCQAAREGDQEKAELIDQRLRALHQLLFLEANPIPVKWALHELGLIPPGIRLPLTYLSTIHHAALKKAMQEAGLC